MVEAAEEVHETTFTTDEVQRRTVKNLETVTKSALLTTDSFILTNTALMQQVNETLTDKYDLTLEATLSRTTLEDSEVTMTTSDTDLTSLYMTTTMPEINTSSSTEPPLLRNGTESSSRFSSSTEPPFLQNGTESSFRYSSSSYIVTEFQTVDADNATSVDLNETRSTADFTAVENTTLAVTETPTTFLPTTLSDEITTEETLDVLRTTITSITPAIDLDTSMSQDIFSEAPSTHALTTEPPYDSTTQMVSSDLVPIIVGACVGAVFMVLLVVLIVCLKKRHDRRRKSTKYRDEENIQDYKYELKPTLDKMTFEDKNRNNGTFMLPQDDISFDLEEENALKRPETKNYFQEGLKELQSDDDNDVEDDTNTFNSFRKAPLRYKASFPMKPLSKQPRQSVGPIILQDDSPSTQNTYDKVYTHNTFRKK